MALGATNGASLHPLRGETIRYPEGVRHTALQRRGAAATSTVGAPRLLRRHGPTLREADCGILTGDLTHFGDPPDAFRVVDAVRQFFPRVLAVTGNLDFV